MGAHESKQTSRETTRAVAKAVQSVSQGCVSYTNANNEIAITGNGNVVGNVTQSLSIAVDTTCSAQMAQSADFQTKLLDGVVQNLQDSEAALTQWMDNSKVDTGASVNQRIATSVTSKTAQTCVNKLQHGNILNVTGSGNVVHDIVQTQTVNLLTQCLLSDQQVSSAVSDVTNTINQHSAYTSKSPLAYFLDAVTAEFAMALLAMIFIILISFVLLFALRRRGRASREYSRPPPASPSTAPSSAPPAALFSSAPPTTPPRASPRDPPRGRRGRGARASTPSGRLGKDHL